MTIRLLANFNGFDANSIIDLDAATEAGLVAQNAATTDLNGGTRRYRAVSAPGTAAPAQIPRSASLQTGEQVTLPVPAGYRLAIIAGAASQGSAEVLGDAGEVKQARAFTTGTTYVGPFLKDQPVRLSCLGGTVSTATHRAPSAQGVCRSIMWMGDSITAQGSNMAITPRGRGTRVISAPLSNINAAGLFVVRIEAGPMLATGTGTMRYYVAQDALSWQAAGDIEGPRVPVPTAGFFKLESGTADKEIYVGTVSRNKPTVDKSDSVSIAGAMRLRNNTSSNGIVGWSQCLLNNAFSDSFGYGISTLRTAEWLAARAQWENVYSDITHIFLGTNDNTTDVTQKASLLDLEEIVRARQAIGSIVVVGGLLPCDTRTADQTRSAVDFNRELRAMGERLGFDVWDAFQYLYSATGTGGFVAGMAKDGLHPTSLGGYTIAKNCIVPILRKYTRPSDPLLFAGAAYDAVKAPYGNLLTNGQFAGVVAASNPGITGDLPTNWTLARNSGSIITATSKVPGSASPVIRTDGKQGAYWSIDVSNAGGTDGESVRARLASFITSGFAPGDYLVIEGDLQISGTGMVALEANIALTGGVDSRYGLGIYADTDPVGRMGNLNGDTVTIPFRSAPLRVEVGDTNLNVWFTLYMGPNGTARLNIGQNLIVHRVPMPVLAA